MNPGCLKQDFMNLLFEDGICRKSPKVWIQLQANSSQTLVPSQCDINRADTRFMDNIQFLCKQFSSSFVWVDTFSSWTKYA